MRAHFAVCHTGRQPLATCAAEGRNRTPSADAHRGGGDCGNRLALPRLAVIRRQAHRFLEPGCSHIWHPAGCPCRRAAASRPRRLRGPTYRLEVRMTPLVDRLSCAAHLLGSPDERRLEIQVDGLSPSRTSAKPSSRTKHSERQVIPGRAEFTEVSASDGRRQP